MVRRLTGIAVALVLTLAGNQALAQSSWSDPDGGGYSSGTASGTGDERLQSLIDALNKELDRGEKERLLDPWFLRDLRGIVSQYDWPWGKTILSDRFDGKGPQPDPPWQVTAGEFLIDWRHGLRSVIDKGKAASTTSSNDSSGSGGKNDAAKQLLGALLQGALGGSSGGSKSTSQSTASSAPAFSAVQATIDIPNAFAIDMEVSERQLASGASDGFEFGPYQGTNASIGYRLSYIAGANGGPGELQLLQLTRRGTATIDRSNQPVSLTGDAASRIVWTRDGQGRMQVQVNGATVIDTVDRGFRDPFNGFAVLNRGGDIALRQITISGAGS